MGKKKQRNQGRYRGRGGNQGGQGGQQGGQGGRGGYNRQGGGGGGGNRYQNRRRNYANEPRQDDFAADNGDGSALFAGSGVLEMHPNGYGFLRDPASNFTRERTDPFVPGTMIEKFGLREGVLLSGLVQPQRKQQGPRLRELLDVDGMAPEDYVNVKTFDELTPISPEEWFRLETGQQPLSTRVMDLLTPLGKGQRALIVAPPRTGKTVLMQQVSQAISQNYPEVTMVVMLIDERPEEVTDMKRNVNGEVFASSLDRDVESHVRLAQLVVARCQRLAEMGKDVFMLMDSITRLARAFNKWVGNTGRTMSGGVDIKAMDIPKKLFATARAFEEGGSLTICGTALIDTGSRMDELIFQEFKGTGNMELVLDRKLADRRVFPAIDIEQSGTRREEKLLPPETLHATTMLRRTLSSMHHVDAMEQLTTKLGKFKSNAEFVSLIKGAGVD
ncbi:MAG: transcription termination factor Rho [Pirellulales bacterium]|nr:transcription termination factor Rho [Pirellulales bacterium]MBX3434130.1 transcription termination factor Rho [Pirellulales bacterium]